MTSRFLTPTQRLAVLNACAAVYGLAAGASLLPLWLQPARPGQLPGYITELGFDSHAPFRFMAGLMILPVVMPLLLRPVLRRLAADGVHVWARNTAALAMLAALWYVILQRDPWWTWLAPAAAIALAYFLRDFRARFSRWDAILLAAFAPIFLGIMDAIGMPLERLTFTSAGIVFAIRIAVALLRRNSSIPPAFYFAISPLAMILQGHFNARDIRYNGWPPLAVAIVSPFVLAFLLRDSATTKRRMRWLLTYVIYPLAIVGHVSATSLITAEGKNRGSLFEDAHHMTPANELMRGEKPYRDIVPAHGFVQDALWDYLMMQTGRRTSGELHKARGLISTAGSIALYAVVVCATGSPNAGLLTFFLGSAFGAAGGNLRSLPAVLFIAATAYAMRRRNAKGFFWSGAFVSAATLTSLDFGAYIFLTLVVILFRTERRLAATKWAAIGVAAVAGPAMIGFAIAGVAVDFVRTTFFEVLTLGPVYTLSPFEPPEGFERYRFPPEALLTLFDKTSFLYTMWAVAVVFVGAALAMPRVEMSPRRRARIEALLVIAIFSVMTALSYAERHHLYNHFVVGPLVGVALFLMFRSRLAAVRRLAPVATLVAIMAAYGTLHLIIIAMVRGARGPLDQGWEEVTTIPRAKGTLFHEHDRLSMESARKYIETLPPGKTWFDFTNRGALYFLFDRDCPIRQME
ncbi:MAG TPA: hypothetical protein VF698_18305, partial [Thermoanaerobaculia bacterium]